MRATLIPGVEVEWTATVEPRHLVPALFPESRMAASMPPVLATPWLAAMAEYTTVLGLMPHLENGEASVGTRIEVEHQAASPLGATITLIARCTAVENRRTEWIIIAWDNDRQIGQATHTRMTMKTRT